LVFGTRKLVGFYTDEHGKVRPITAKTGKRRVTVKLVRSAHAVNVDRALKAPVAKSTEQWYKQPNRYDLPGVDSPEDKTKSLNISKANSKSEEEKMTEEKIKAVEEAKATGIHAFSKIVTEVIDDVALWQDSYFDENEGQYVTYWRGAQVPPETANKIKEKIKEKGDAYVIVKVTRWDPYGRPKEFAWAVR